jgi:hypothetical protein
MTNWQWRVIVGLCRLVLILATEAKLDFKGYKLSREQNDQCAEDMAFLEEAIEKENERKWKEWMKRK